MTAPLPVRVLAEDAYKRYIAPVRSRGWNDSTHFAEIDFGDGREEAVVKLLICDTTWPQAGNEAIGHVLARLGEIPGPQKAGILVADAGFLAMVLGSDYPADAPREGDVLAWCASLVPHLKISTWTQAREEAVMRAVLKSECGARIAALDLWLCNGDRNPHNLLRLPGGKWAAIDHEMLFMTTQVRGDWRHGPIDHLPASSTLYYHARALYLAGQISAKQMETIESRMLLCADQHPAIAAEAAPRLAPLLEKLYPGLAYENVLRFIADRAPVAWMRDQLNRLL